MVAHVAVSASDDAENGAGQESESDNGGGVENVGECAGEQVDCGFKKKLRILCETVWIFGKDYGFLKIHTVFNSLYCLHLNHVLSK